MSCWFWLVITILAVFHVPHLEEEEEDEVEVAVELEVEVQLQVQVQVEGSGRRGKRGEEERGGGFVSADGGLTWLESTLS